MEQNNLDINLLELQKAIEAEDIAKIKELMKKHNLILKNSKIIPANPDEYKRRTDFWDKRQYVRKILLNSSKATYNSNVV
jgi:hypothetical protein